jgi:hypothetical protein
VRIYAYIDGESHYMRSLSSRRKLQGDDAELFQIVPNKSSSQRIEVERGYQFFWDDSYRHMAPAPFNQYPIERKIYFTAFSGAEQDFHAACVSIRKRGFEPHVHRHRDRPTRNVA